MSKPTLDEIKALLEEVTENGDYPLLYPFLNKKVRLNFATDPVKTKKNTEEKILKEIGILALEGKDFSSLKAQLEVLRNQPLPEKELSDLSYHIDQIAGKVEAKLNDGDNEITTLIEPLVTTLLVSVCRIKGVAPLALAIQLTLPEVFAIIIRSSIIAFFLRQAMQQKGLSLIKFEKTVEGEEKEKMQFLTKSMAYASLKALGAGDQDYEGLSAPENDEPEKAN